MAEHGTSTQPTHHEHDLLLVAALADRDLTGEEAERARAQVAACTDCAALHADLLSLARATRVLPPIARPRDFRLRPADAQRLRPSLVRRILGSFGTARDGFSRPLAMGLTTLGLAGLLVGTIPNALPSGGAAGGAPIDQGAELYSMSAASPAASAAPAAAPGASAGTAQGEGAGEDSPIANPIPTPQRELGFPGNRINDTAGDGDVARLAPDSTSASQLVVISGTLLIMGLGLFALRWTSRRFGD